MIGMIFLEESKKNKESKNPERLMKKWQEIIGKEEAEEILNNHMEEKEALIFEAERHSEEGNINNTSIDVLRRIELKHLKQRLQRTAALLDDAGLSKEKEKEAKAEFKEIQKRIKEFGY